MKKLTLLVSILCLGCLLLVLSLSPAKALEYNDFEYEIKGNGTAIITGYNKGVEYLDESSLYVPKMVDGYTVTEIGPYAFAAYDFLTWDIIEEYIDFGANRRSLGSILVLPETITAIGEKAFFNTNFRSINIPTSCRSIGSGAFAGTWITNYTVEPDNPVFAVIDGVLFDKTKKELVAYPVYNDRKEYEIPEGIISIGEYAFCGARLTSIILPSSLKTIESYGFADAGISSSLDLNNVEEIKAHGFERSCLDINFSQIRSIGDYAFLQASSTSNSDKTTIMFPPTLESLGKSAFEDYNNKTRKTIDLSATKLKTIDAATFKGIQYIEKILLPECMETIGESAFANIYTPSERDTNISVRNNYCTIFIPSSVKSIEKKAFENSTICLTIAEDSNIEFIDSFAFNGTFLYDEELQNNNMRIAIPYFQLPDKLQTLGEKAFFTRNTIATLYIPQSVTSIGAEVSDSAKTQLKVESGSYAEFYASENGFQTIINGTEDTSWLNN